MSRKRLGSVFISHSAKEPDHSVARSLAEGLKEVGIDVWWDEDGLEGGDSFAVEILEAIIRQYYFLFVVSPRSVDSKWCNRERIRADELGKKIVPIILEDVPREQSPLDLAGVQYVDIRRGVSDAMPSLLRALGLGQSAINATRDDPFARDGRLIKALADGFRLLRHCSPENSMNANLVVRTIGLACCETPRAREIFERMWAVKTGKVQDYDSIPAFLEKEWQK